MEVSMKKFLWLLGFLCAFGANAFAQETPKGEVFVGYSYFRNNLVENRGVNANGVNISAAYNFNKTVGVVGDFGAYIPSGRPGTPNVYSYLVGPRLSYRSDSRITPFAQFLIGGATRTSTATFRNSASGFAFTAGGGLDVKVNDKITFRPAQAEFFRTRFDGDFQNNFRFSTGVVFTFGKK
jgi:opacity protein-like surface antigen